MTNDERKTLVQEKLNDGVSLSDIQKELSNAGERISYLELRIMASTMQVNWEAHGEVKEKEGGTIWDQEVD